MGFWSIDSDTNEGGYGADFLLGVAGLHDLITPNFLKSVPGFQDVSPSLYGWLRGDNSEQRTFYTQAGEKAIADGALDKATQLTANSVERAFYVAGAVAAALGALYLVYKFKD